VTQIGEISHAASRFQRGVSRPQCEGGKVSEHQVSRDNGTLEIVQAAKCELAENALRVFGSLRLRVTGFSMLPAIWPGDLLLIRRQAMEQILPGDIVLFARDGRLIAHRAVCKTGDRATPSLITRGDALPSFDSAVSAAELLGKVCGVFREGEWIEPRKRLGFGARALSLLVSRSGRAAGIFWRLRAVWLRAGKLKGLCQN
jgi:hypothetical protein